MRCGFCFSFFGLVAGLVGSDRVMGGVDAGFALQFEDDVLKLPAGSFEGSGDFTVEVWVNVTAMDPKAESWTNTFISLANELTDDVFVFGQGPVGQIRFVFSGMESPVDVGPELCLNVWQHVALIRMMDQLTVYIDGEDVATVTVPLDLLDLGNSGAWMGQEQDCLGDCFESDEAHDGLFDELRIWSVGRTGEEIRAALNRPLIGNEPGLQAYFKFDEGKGQIASDSSPNAYSAILGEKPNTNGDPLDPLWVVSSAPIFINGLCAGDANGDGTVDPLDAGFVLSRFGCLVAACDPACDASDQNADGAVDPLDVGFVLSRFGDCL